jgi:hypothetical protein
MDPLKRPMTRPYILRPILALTASVLALTTTRVGGADASLNIGSRRELFVDDALVERLTGKAELRLHHPVPQEIAIVHDAPWEGSGCGYHSIFKDGGLYRMYYKAYQLTVTAGKIDSTAHPRFCGYAESDDGIHWRKPALGLHEFQGSKANNIVLTSGKAVGLDALQETKGGGEAGVINPDAAHPAVFKDENPNATPDARYKAILRSNNPKGLLAFKSPDGIHWSPMSNQPVITDPPGKTDSGFDSQNLAFWDGVRGEYRAYWRYYTGGVITGRGGQGFRAIRTAASKDFLHWENHADLTYGDAPPEQLYTNQIKPYFRTPHILIGFPARYIDRGWSDSMRALPEREHREWRAAAQQREGTALTDALIMASRDGVTFKRWPEAFLRPGIEHEGTWNYGHQFMAWHVVETKSALAGAPNELSLYATESYWTGTSDVLRRYTLRLDGFVSLHAPMSGGELITKPLTFTGTRLALNFSTSAAGSVRVELQDANGNPLPGFTLADCPPIFGDNVERPVTWKQGGDVSRLAGRVVRLRFRVNDADVYAFQFVE